MVTDLVDMERCTGIKDNAWLCRLAQFKDFERDLKDLDVRDFEYIKKGMI